MKTILCYYQTCHKQARFCVKFIYLQSIKFEFNTHSKSQRFFSGTNKNCEEEEREKCYLSERVTQLSDDENFLKFLME